MQKLEVSGKNIEQAIELGLGQLGLCREDVNIHIIDAGGMFKKAKIVLEYEGVEMPEKDMVSTPTPTPNPAPTSSAVTEQTAEEKEKFVRPARTYSLEPRPQIESAVTEFLTGLCTLNESDCKIEYKYTSDGLIVRLDGENVGKLIGFHGESMNAVQIILNGITSRMESSIYIILDIEGYRAKREEVLTNIANKSVVKALENKRDYIMDPMNAYERRVIHNVASGIKGVTTESMGEGRNRHVVIKIV